MKLLMLNTYEQFAAITEDRYYALGQGETYLSKHLVLCRSFIFVGVGIFEYCDISAWFYALLLLSLGLVCMYCYKMKKNTTLSDKLKVPMEK